MGPCHPWLRGVSVQSGWPYHCDRFERQGLVVGTDQPSSRVVPGGVCQGKGQLAEARIEKNPALKERVSIGKYLWDVLLYICYISTVTSEPGRAPRYVRPPGHVSSRTSTEAQHLWVISRPDSHQRYQWNHIDWAGLRETLAGRRRGREIMQYA